MYTMCTHTHIQTTYLENRLTWEFPLDFHALLMEKNATISGYSVGGLYIRKALYFIIVQCVIYLKIRSSLVIDFFGLPGIYHKSDTFMD